MCKVKEPQVNVAPAATLEELTAKKPFVKAHETQKDFHWVATDEPHATRRKLILAKYPQIKELFGHCWKTKYITLFVVLLQTYCAYQSQFLGWPAYLALAYVIGGTCNHAMMMSMHELSHNLGFKKMIYNRLLGIFANLPVGVPSAVSFKRYHMEHHRYQGEEGVDVDLPTAIEGKVFNNVITKFLFVVFQVLFYAFRPLVVNPKAPGLWEAYNWIACMSYNLAIFYVGGPSSLAYLFLSSLFGSGIHPVAGHFIAEHYVFVLGYETYSYYGILNYFTFNVGYHNEHHDFPYVPGSRLHRVREIAPEFYDNLPQHESWVKVMFDYVTDKNIGAFSRVKRHNLTEDAKNKMKAD
ncbi:Fatty acid desaturase family, zn-binding site, partial [Globisporangium splendens]